MKSALVVSLMGMFAALVLCPVAPAQTPSTANTMHGTTSNGPDGKFAQTAAAGGLAEVAMAKAAQQRAGSGDVKKFAERMIADHGKANRELASIAASKGVALPTEISGKDKRELSKLENLEGAKFDKEYIASQVAAHKDAVKLFKSESSRGGDSELKTFAAATLPTLEEHLSMITALSKGAH